MRDMIKACIKNGDKVLPELEAQKICKAYGIECPPTKLIKTKEECVAAGDAMGYPVVIKIFSKQIIHKSDVGGVIVGIKDGKSLGEAYETMMVNVSNACPNAIIDGVVVQKMMHGGVEIVVGALKNQQFGPVVMFGMGGIYIEVMKDVEFRLAPIEKEEAFRQIKETKIYEILQGVRGQAPCDLDALAQTIVNVSRLICDFDEIKEIDFNPVLCYESGCIAVDARMIIGN